jgi:phosphatidylserine/phosphatidylglycerophosphate/cardiolipin synthase-like enzyme
MSLLAAGTAVTRTAGDLVRYHAKLLLVDRRQLFVLGYNFTRLDIERSRGFGFITTNRSLVLEAARLFEADSKRQPYSAGLKSFVVSPLNARAQLASFLEGARKELLIYDPEISDPKMLRLLADRLGAGVAIRIIGRVKKFPAPFAVREQPKLRLHARAIVRDGRRVFIGSQSLRANELDKRREVGVIFDNARIAARLAATFEEDWKTARPAAAPAEVAKAVAKAVADELPPVAPVVTGAVRQATGSKNGAVPIDKGAIEETVKDAVKEAVKDLVKEAVEQAS